MLMIHALGWLVKLKKLEYSASLADLAPLHDKVAVYFEPCTWFKDFFSVLSVLNLSLPFGCLLLLPCSGTALSLPHMSIHVYCSPPQIFPWVALPTAHTNVGQGRGPLSHCSMHTWIEEHLLWKLEQSNVKVIAKGSPSLLYTSISTL